LDGREPSHIADGNIKQCSHLEKHFGSFLRVKHQFNKNPTTPLLGFYPRAMKTMTT
jgi:hypothetical protein